MKIKVTVSEAREVKNIINKKGMELMSFEDYLGILGTQRALQIQAAQNHEEKITLVPTIKPF